MDILMSSSACKTNITKYQPQQKFQHTTNWGQDDRRGNSSTQSQAPEDGSLMSETCWAHNKWNKIASDIKLVFHSSTIAMMHGPINIWRYVSLTPDPITALAVSPSTHYSPTVSLLFVYLSKALYIIFSLTLLLAVPKVSSLLAGTQNVCRYCLLGTEAMSEWWTVTSVSDKHVFIANWRWRQHELPKPRYLSTNPHGLTRQKTIHSRTQVCPALWAKGQNIYCALVRGPRV